MTSLNEHGDPNQTMTDRFLAEATADAGALIRRTISYLSRRIQVQRAILFGSHANGSADQWSDVDLAVVSPDFERMNHRQMIDLMVEVALAVDPRVEIRPYSPRDLAEARSTNFLGHILATGKVVHRGGTARGGRARAARQRMRARRGAVERRKRTL